MRRRPAGSRLKTQTKINNTRCKLDADAAVYRYLHGFCFVNLARETGPHQFSKTIVNLTETGRWCQICTVFIDCKRFFLTGNRPAGAAARASSIDLTSADLIPGDRPQRSWHFGLFCLFGVCFRCVFLHILFPGSIHPLEGIFCTRYSGSRQVGRACCNCC